MSYGKDPAKKRPEENGSDLISVDQTRSLGLSRPHIISDSVRSLTVENLGKQYENRPVVRGVSLSIERGEVVGLLGPNGAGKTTCFYIITGLVKPDYGTILLDLSLIHI